MNKTSVEFELLAPSRDKPGGQQQQYARWPYDVVDPVKCEFEYRVFRDAYNKLNTDYETGGLYANALTDAELRMRWLDYYVCYETPSQRQIARWAHDVNYNRHSSAPSSPDLMKCAAALVLLIMFTLLLLR